MNTDKMSTDKMSTDKVDYLTVDDPIAGQNYACISFISPESLIMERQAFNSIKFRSESFVRCISFVRDVWVSFFVFSFDSFVEIFSVY